MRPPLLDPLFASLTSLPGIGPKLVKLFARLLDRDTLRVADLLFHLPAGTIDPGESPDQTAERELREETGYQAGRIRRIREWYVSPGVMNERMYLYLCEDLLPGSVRPELDEDPETVIVPWEEAMAMADDGRIEDAKTLLALMICERLRRSSPER